MCDLIRRDQGVPTRLPPCSAVDDARASGLSDETMQDISGRQAGGKPDRALLSLNAPQPTI
jgi:hypothetical protein